MEQYEINIDLDTKHVKAVKQYFLLLQSYYQGKRIKSQLIHFIPSLMKSSIDSTILNY